MSALDNLHTFAIGDTTNGGNLIEVFRRIDLHRIRKIATMLVEPSVGVDIDKMGEAMCKELDWQRAHKAAAEGGVK